VFVNEAWCFLLLNIMKLAVVTDKFHTLIFIGEAQGIDYFANCVVFTLCVFLDQTVVFKIGDARYQPPYLYNFIVIENKFKCSASLS